MPATKLRRHTSSLPPAAPRDAAVRALAGRDLISMADLSPAEFSGLLGLAREVKADPRDFRTALEDRQVVLVFEKPSLRTRVTFEAAMNSLGGHAIFLDHRGCRVAEREPVRDVARNFERWLDGIVLRTYEHGVITEMAEHASIPVVNALSDFEHPTEALADFLSLEEKLGDLRGVKLAYVGDGNNVAHSLLLAAALAGSVISVATPPGHGPCPEVVEKARAIAANTGGQIIVTHSAAEAAAGAEAVYTDVWASMGQEDEAEARREIFAEYQVNEALIAHAAPHALFMHCLPAHRGDEVTAAVMDSPRSVVFLQAENRLHVHKAILISLIGAGGLRFPARSARA